jgi:hypothetical protein
VSATCTTYVLIGEEELIRSFDEGTAEQRAGASLPEALRKWLAMG